MGSSDTLEDVRINKFWVLLERISSFLIKHLGIVILIMICGIVSYYTYTGIFMGDDTLYIDNLFRLKNGIALRDPIRFPILILEAISYILFGKDISSIPILFSFIYPSIVMLVYLISYKLCNKRGISLIAAIICAGCSILYIYGGAIIPDDLAALFILFSYLFFIFMYKSNSKKRYLHMVFCAVSIVCAFMMKEIFLASLIGFIPLALHLQPNRKFKKIVFDFLLITLVAIIVFSVYILFLYLTGNSGARLIDMNFTKTEDGAFSVQRSTQIWNESKGIFDFSDRATFSFSLLKKMFPSAIYLLVFSLLILIYSIIKKEKRIIAFTSGAFVFLGIICFMPLSINPYYATYLNERYLVVLCPLLSIATALSITFIKNKQRLLLLTFFIISIAAFFWNFSIKTKGYYWIKSMSQIVNEVNIAIKQSETIQPDCDIVFDAEIFSGNAMSRVEFYYDLEYPDKDMVFLSDNEDKQLAQIEDLQLNIGTIVLLNSVPNAALNEYATKYASLNNYSFIVFRLADTRIKVGYFRPIP